MGEAKNKKQKIEKYLQQIKEFTSTLPIYQQKKEIILYKSGKEILELHKNNMLSIKRIRREDQTIRIETATGFDPSVCSPGERDLGNSV